MMEKNKQIFLSILFSLIIIITGFFIEFFFSFLKSSMGTLGWVTIYFGITLLISFPLALIFLNETKFRIQLVFICLGLGLITSGSVTSLFFQTAKPNGLVLLISGFSMLFTALISVPFAPYPLKTEKELRLLYFGGLFIFIGILSFLYSIWVIYFDSSEFKYVSLFIFILTGTIFILWGFFFLRALKKELIRNYDDRY